MNPLLVVVGIALSASAQVALKLAGRFQLWSGRWLAGMAMSVLLYGASFVAYALILRKSEISRVGPIMASSVAVLAAASGFLAFGERFDAGKAVGIALAAAAIFLLSR